MFFLFFFAEIKQLVNQLIEGIFCNGEMTYRAVEQMAEKTFSDECIKHSFLSVTIPVRSAHSQLSISTHWGDS